MTASSERSDDVSAIDRTTAPSRRVTGARGPSTSDVHAVGSTRRPAPVPELQPGDVLEGRYTLLSPLGEGGMGDVWLAHNPTLDVKVALKVLRADVNQPRLRAELTQRLLFEARTAAKLVHPAIVRIIDFGETPSGNGFYVMELLEGEDLLSVLERHGRLSPSKAVRTLLPIASALVAAHGKQVVHRDVKPENIFLAREPERSTVQPKLIDFGVAKLSIPHQRLTQAGSVVGSPDYMAPEQARGLDVDERADIWGFTVVLYEALTGRLPFEGDNYNALMRSIIDDPHLPVTNFGVTDVELAAIINRGLAKDPARRWPSMRELGDALASWLLAQGVTEDICGGQLATQWLRAPSEVAIDASQIDPFVSAAIPAGRIDEARRARAELATEPPPGLVVVQPAAPPARPRFSLPRWVAGLAIIGGIGGGLALGISFLRRPAPAVHEPQAVAAAVAPDMADEPATQPASESPVAATAVVSVSVATASAGVPATSPPAVRVPPARPMAVPRPKPSATPSALPAPPPLRALKTPY